MEKNINEKVKHYIINMKQNMIQLIHEIDNNKLHELISFIEQYPLLYIDKNDFTKRKRIKNIVPLYDRCLAKIANTEQCTRRRKENSEYCGTHTKGIPHGVFDKNVVNKIEKIEVFVKEIKGINYYLDENNNVYKTEDILNNIKNPRVIAKYIIKDNEYFIPELNI